MTLPRFLKILNSYSKYNGRDYLKDGCLVGRITSSCDSLISTFNVLFPKISTIDIYSITIIIRKKQFILCELSLKLMNQPTGGLKQRYNARHHQGLIKILNKAEDTGLPEAKV